jgi:hypothetical protein
LFFLKKKDFFKYYKVYNFYNIANKLLNLNIYEKKDFNLFYFNKINYPDIDIYRLKNFLKIFKNFSLIKFIINLRNFLFLFFIQLLIYWLNFLLEKKKSIVILKKDFSIYYNLLFSNKKKIIALIKKPR